MKKVYDILIIINLYLWCDLHYGCLSVSLLAKNLPCQPRVYSQNRHLNSIIAQCTLVGGSGRIEFRFCCFLGLSGPFWVRQAQREVVKIFFFDFSYWASSTPWGHDLSLQTFCRNPALSWAIRFSVFQPVKFTSSFEFVCGTLFSIFWHLVVKFGPNGWF